MTVITYLVSIYRNITLYLSKSQLIQKNVSIIIGYDNINKVWHTVCQNICWSGIVSNILYHYTVTRPHSKTKTLNA